MAMSNGAVVASGDEGVVRIGRIEFANCFPLYHHFEEELAERGFAASVVEGHPSALNELLVSGGIDATLSSSITFARNADELLLLPQVTISSFGAVDSIQLFTREPLPRVRRIALTEKSATSICLLKVLCAEWGITPEFVPRCGSLAEVLATCDGLLLIGDDALHVLRDEVYPHHCDLGAAWREITGLPMVYAVCIARRSFAEGRPAAAAAVGAALLASRDRCAARPQQTAAAAALQYNFTQRYLEEYFEKLEFTFASAYRDGLREFYRRAYAIGELERVPELFEHDTPPRLREGGAPTGASPRGEAP